MEENLSYIKEVHIPQYISEIGDDDFRGNKNIIRAFVIDSVKIIEKRAFLGCYNLEKIELPKTIWLFGSYGVFSRCKALKEIKIPIQVKTIEQSTFSDCVSLEEIKIPENVQKICESAFSSCISLKMLSYLNLLKKYAG